jgi:capsular exopolysaccharide synthesis family protein
MSRNRTTKNTVQLEQKELIGPNLNFAASEAYKRLRTNLMFALPSDGKCRVVGVTSAVQGEGKSTTAINLAYSLAEADIRVLLIEADMRLPTIAKRLGLEGTPGLSNLLAGLNDGVIQPSGVQEKFWFISAGDIPPNPSELLGSEQMKQAIESLSKSFEVILLDLPPINAVSDPLVVSKLTNGMIVVVRQNYSNRRALSAAMRQLKFAGAKVLGFVLTASNSGRKKNGRYGGKYGYGYGYGYGYEHSKQPENTEATQ